MKSFLIALWNAFKATLDVIAYLMLFLVVVSPVTFGYVTISASAMSGALVMAAIFFVIAAGLEIVIPRMLGRAFQNAAS